MILDNLAPLFGGGQPGVRFRQGTILSWDPATGENTVDLAGGTLTDVPILNTGEAIALKAGHIVGMLGQGSSWFIIGRVTPPNDPNFAGASVAFGGAGSSAGGFSITATPAAKVTDAIVVPDWADEAIVLAVANISLDNSANLTTGYTVQMQVLIDGVGGGGAYMGLGIGSDNSVNYLNSTSASAQRLITNPGPTIALAANAWTDFGGTLAADPSNIVNLDAIAVFRSTV